MDQWNAINEVLEFAIAREIEANEFFLALASRVENPAISGLFQELAREELEHKESLELELLKQGAVLAELPKVPDAEKLANLKIADYMVDTGDPLVMDYEDVLVLGMKKEKVSFRLYIDLAEMIQEQDLHEMLLLLAEEEARHKMRFEIEYDKITQKKKNP